MKRVSLLLTLLIFSSFTAHADPVFSTGDGSAVSSIDRFASFDTLTEGNDLSAYSEDSINVFVNDIHCCFNGAYYAESGHDAGNISDSLYRIFTADSARFFGVEILLKDWGYEGSYQTFVWETYRNGSLTGTDTISTPAGDTIMGWFDAAGIDELRIGVFAGTNNALWFDDLKMQVSDLGSATPVPATNTWMLLLLSLMVLGVAWNFRPAIKR
jgi:hypothetical protein